MKTKKEADTTACRKNITKKQQTKDGTATVLRFFCRCPKMPMRSYFSPAKLSRLASCDTLLPSPGVKRRGHDIHAQTRAPFCECGEKRNAVEHSRSIRYLYYNNRLLPCQASFPQDLPPCAHADPGRICGCPDPASCAAEFTRQSAARRIPRPSPAS